MPDLKILELGQIFAPVSTHAIPLATGALTNAYITIGDITKEWVGNVDAKSFNLLNVGEIQINNPADTFQYIITSGAIVADRIVNLPVLTGTDTFVFEAFAQTLTNKTITLGGNTISGTFAEFNTAVTDATLVDLDDAQSLSNKTLVTPTIVSFVNATHDHQAAAGGGTLLSTAALSDTANIAYLNQSNIFGAFDTSFQDLRLQINNPANTFQYIFDTNAIVADRNIILPLLTGNDTFVFEAFAATLTNKTVDADNNTITNIGSSEVKSELITGQTQVAPLGADELLITDASDAGNLKRVLISALPTGSSLPVVDTTSIAEGSADATKEVRFEVDGNTTGIIGVLATAFTTAKTVTFPDATDTLVGKATTDIFTNKSINADGTGNVITNIGSSEIKSEMITGFGTVTAASGDFVLISDTTDAGNLKKVDALDFLGGTSLPVVDTTSIAEGSGDATKEVRFEVDGNTTGIIGVLATIFTTAKTITFPDATDTLVGKATTDVFTNKSLDANGTGNVITNIGDAEIEAHTSTKITIIAKGQLNSNIVYTDQANTFGAFDTSFQDLRLQINNPANTFQYIFDTNAIVADRNVILPLLTGNDTFVFEAFAATLTNKTIDADGTGNVITNIGSSEIKSEMITGFGTVTAASGDFVLISDTGDSGNLKKVDALDFLGGTSLPVVDTTSIAEGSADATKEVRFEVDGNTTGIIGVLATIFTTAKTITFPDATDTLMGKATTDIMLNKSLDADGTGNVITNIGFSEIKSEMITGAATVTGISGDFVLISDTTDSGNLKKVDVLDFLGGGEVFTWTADHDAADFDLLQVDNITSGANTLHNWDIERDANLANDTEIGSLRFRARDQPLVVQNYARISGTMESDATANEDGSLKFFVTENGVHDVLYMSMNDASSDNINIFKEFHTNGSNIRMGSGILQFQGVDFEISGGARFIFETNGGQNLAFDINSTREFEIRTGELDVFDNNLLRVGTLQLNNVADTFQYIFTGAAIVADRILTLPLLTGPDTLVTEAFAQTLTGKTIDADGTGNVITNIGSSEIKSEIITGFGTVTAISGDFILISDTSDAGNLKKVDALDFLGGASQTPWIADIDAANFSLRNLDILEFNENVDVPVITNAEIYWDSATGMQFNVPTGDHVQIRINGVAEYTFDAAALDLQTNNLLIGNTNIIQWDGSANRRIFNSTNGFVFEVETSDTFVYEVQNVTEWTLDATQLLGGSNNNIVLTGTGFAQMDEQAGDPATGTTSGKYYVKVVGGIARPFFIGDGLAATDLTAGGGSQTPWTSNIDAAEFDLTDVGLIRQKIDNATAVFEMEANHTTPAAAQVISQFDFIDDSSTGVRRTYATISSLISNPANTAEDGEIKFNILTDGSGFDYMIMKDFIIDLNGNTLDNVAVYISGNVNPALVGAMRFGNAQGIFFRNAANTADHSITFTSADVFDFSRPIKLGVNALEWLTGESISIQTGDMIFDVPTTDIFSWDIAGTPEMTLSATQLDLKNNDIIDIGEGTITGLTTVTGASGDFLMMVDATDGLMKKVDAVDFLGGSSPPFVDTTSIVEGSADATKELRFEVDGNTTGIIGVIATAFTTAKTVTIPNATDTLVGKATTDVFTNKSIDANGTGNVITNIGDAETETFTTTKISTLSKGLLNTAIVYNDQINTFGDFVQTFKDNALHLENPAGTFDVVFQTSAEVTSDRILTIPLLGANRTMVVTGLTSQITIGTEVTGASTALTDTADIVYLNQPNTYGAFLNSFVAATMRIPLSATPTMAVNGDFAIDTTVTDFSHGVLKFFDGEEIGVVAMPIAQFTTPTDGHVVSYNATNDEFELVAPGAASLPVVDTTSIAEGSADATKEVRFEVDGNTTGIVGVLATAFTTAKTITFPDVTDTLAVKGANTFTATQNLGGNILQNTGDVAIGQASPTAGKTLSVTIPDDTVGSGFIVQNTDGFISFTNGTGVANEFQPFLSGLAVGSTRSLFISGRILVADDTGTLPAIRFEARRDDDTAVVNRPIASFSNIGFSKLIIDINGELQFVNQGAGADPILFSNDAGQTLDLTGGLDISGQLDIVGANINLTSSFNLQWDGNANRRIVNSGVGFVFEVETGDTFNFEIVSVPELVFSAATFDLSQNTVTNILMGSGAFVQMGENAADPAAGTTSGKFYVKEVGGLARPFFIGDGTAAIALDQSGSEVFTWTADHSGGGFDLVNVNQLGINQAAVTAGKTVAITIPDDTSGEGLIMQNTDGFLEFTNGTATAGDFQPFITGKAVGTNRTFFFSSRIPVANDTGNEAALKFDSRQDDDTPLVNRPIAAWSNLAVSKLIVDTNGELQFVNQGAGTDPILFSNDAAQRLDLTGGLDISGTLVMSGIIDMNSNNITELPGTFISALTTVTGISGDFVMISDTSDSGNLKKVDVLDFLGGGEFTGAWTADHNTGGSAFGLQDALFVDPTVTTKKLQIDLAGMTAAITAILDFNFTTAKTITFPDATDTLVGKATTDIFTNKSYDLGGTGNVLTGSLAEFNTALQTESFAILGANTFTATQILGTNILQFNDVNTTITQVGTDLEIDVASGGSVELRVNNAIELDITDTAINAPTAKFQENAVNISPIGIHDIPVSATGMYDTTTLPATGLTKTELPTNDIDIQTWDFTSTTADERVQFRTPFPRNYNNGTITVTINWSQSSGTGNVVWRVGALATGQGDLIDQAMTFSADLVDAGGTANQIQSATTASFTPSGTPADGDELAFEVMRQGSDVLDTFSGTARLHSIVIHMTTDAAVAA